mgnify:CR=1 FL=1|tara:strand:+ start:1489 stop:1920 length:432 start_codon:yes stop_codon:yes gene_type:complete
MGHKGHWGEYTGNAKWSRDHAHTRVTSKNYDDAVKDDAAHIDYLKRDIDYDAKHGHSDEKMTADEKHISKLAGDMKYDKKHHGMAMSALHKHDEWQVKIDAAKEEWKNADPPKEGDFYEENRKLYEAQEKARLAHDKEKKNNN